MTIGKMFAKKRGFTLVELMIVVVIIGILASLAIYGVQKYVRNSKTAEARSGVGAMSKGAIARYNSEAMAGTLLAVGGTVASSKRLCITSGNNPVPAYAMIKGQKWQSSETNWDESGTDAGITGFTCLKFSMTGPQYFAYSYISNATSTTAGSSFQAVAEGDLDGDDVRSSFAIDGLIDSGTGTLTISPSIRETNPEE